MKAVYQAARISKQGFHQSVDRLLVKLELKAQLLPLMMQVREDHPGMSARNMYSLLQPEGMGRDAFIRWAHQEGFKLIRKKHLQLTTDTSGTRRFDNLIAGNKFTDVNQVWVSDITYYSIQGRSHYITLIMDLYSRLIIGHHLSSSLKTDQTTLPTLQKAIKSRKNICLKDLIFHSDGGGQYYNKSFLDLTQRLGIRNSMSYQVLENSHAERVIGIIKNQYLKGYQPQTTQQLKRCLDYAIKMYNEQKPHRSIGGVSPVIFEKQLMKRTDTIEMWIKPRYKLVPFTHIPTSINDNDDV
jgi:hypothetical protein